MLRKKLSMVLVVLVIVALALSVNFLGCKAAETKEEQKQVTIAVFIPDAGNAYYQNKAYGYYLGRELLKVEYPEYDITLELYDAGGYDKAMNQIAQIEDAIIRGVDAITLSACDSEALVEVAKKALAAGIPVINDDVWVNTETNMSISENSYRVGLNSGEYIAKMLNGKGNVTLIKGPAGVGLFTERARGINEAFARFPDIKIIAEQYNNNDNITVRKIMEDWVTLHGDQIDAFWSTNSMVGSAACDAMEAGGLKKEDVLVIGVDFSDVSLEYMENGWYDGLIPCQPIKTARIALMSAFYASVGRELPEIIYSTDDIVIDSETLPTFDLSDAVCPEGWKPDWKS